jgi:hypothetical protein
MRTYDGRSQILVTAASNARKWTSHGVVGQSLGALQVLAD